VHVYLPVRWQHHQLLLSDSYFRGQLQTVCTRNTESGAQHGLMQIIPNPPNYTAPTTPTVELHTCTGAAALGAAIEMQSLRQPVQTTRNQLTAAD
jgi:hypothetical protein